MMHAVHPQLSRPEYAGETRPFRDRDFMREEVSCEMLPTERELVVLDRSRHLLRDVLKQRAAGREID